MKKRKKIIKLILFFLVVIIIVIFLKGTVFKKYHHINYQIIKDRNKFIIEETYQNKKYYLNIKINKETFPFININNYHKQRKIIHDLIYYDDNTVSCVMPLYQDDFDNEMLCQKDKKLMTYSSLKDYQPLKQFIKTIKDKYPHLSFIDSNNIENYRDYQVYADNIMENIYLMKWNYKGLDLFSDSYQTVKFLKQDLYTNKLGILVNNQYLMADYNSSFTFNKFYLIDIKKAKIKELTVDYDISFDAYINGIVDNKVYLFDRETLVQYEINLNKKEVTIIGNKTLNGKYYDGKWHEINIYDLKKEDLLFEDPDKESYYYQDNTMYHHINDQDVILFKMADISNLIIREDYLYFIKGNTIYGYNEKYGLKKLLINNELTFNKTNIFDFYINK
jgi:hypothetical protein